MARWEHTVGGEIVATPEQVWALWSDAARWPEWNHGMESAELDGPLAVGAQARVRFKDSRRTVAFRVTELDAPDRFVDEGRLPGATLTHVHTIRPADRGVWVEHELSLTGPLATPWAARLRRRMCAAADEFVEAEARLVER